MQVELLREVRDALVDGHAEHGGIWRMSYPRRRPLGETRADTLLDGPAMTRKPHAPARRPHSCDNARAGSAGGGARPSRAARTGIRRDPLRASAPTGRVRGAARRRGRPAGGRRPPPGPLLLLRASLRGFAGVDPRWEWDPHLLAARQALERPFEEALRDAVPSVQVEPGAVEDALRAIVDDDSGPPLARINRAPCRRDAGARIPRAPVGLPVEGSRSSLLGGAAALGKAEGGADRGAGGRVRGRPPGPNARDPVRQGDAGAGLDDGYGAYLEDLPGRRLRPSI